MTLKLDINPTVESALLAQAQARGLSLAAYAQRLLEEHGTAALPPAKLPAHERVRAFSEFAEGFESQAMVTEEAFHRANWYPERG